MGRKKSDYALLFEKMYNLFITNGDNSATWERIFSETNVFIDKFIANTALYEELYDEGKQEIRIAMLRAFRTYDATKDASVYTWTFLLCKQAIFNVIKDKTRYVPCDYLDEIEIDDEFITEERNAEEEMIREEEEDEQMRFKEKLTKILGGPVEVEVFARRFGLFGYEDMKIDEIAEDMRFTKKTIYNINIQNNKKLKQVRQNLDELLK